MDMLLSGALTVGIFAGLWAYGATVINIPAWTGFLGWAVFYAAGGRQDGLVKGVPSCLIGVFWAWVAISIWSKIAPQNILALCLIVSVISFVLVYESKIKTLFSFVPGSFVGASTFFGAISAGAEPWQIVGGLLCGLLIGFVQQRVAMAIARKDKEVIQSTKVSRKSRSIRQKEMKRESITVA